jgi:hypothetical protein
LEDKIGFGDAKPLLINQEGAFFIIFHRRARREGRRKLSVRRIVFSVSFDFKIHLGDLCVLRGGCFYSQKRGGGEDGYGKRHVRWGYGYAGNFQTYDH